MERILEGSAAFTGPGLYIGERVVRPDTDIGKEVVLKEMPTLYFGNPKLTIGKKYKVVDVEGSNFWVIDDEGNKCTFGSCRFDPTADQFPSGRLRYGT